MATGLGYPRKISEYYRGCSPFWAAGVATLFVEDQVHGGISKFRVSKESSAETPVDQTVAASASGPLGGTLQTGLRTVAEGLDSIGVKEPLVAVKDTIVGLGWFRV